MNDVRDFKGVWIPKEIWLSKELSMLEKVVLTEIASLDNESHCVAGNDYFAEFCNCSTSAITKAIKHLQELGFVEQVDFDGRHRVLRVVNFTRLPSKIYEAASENFRPIIYTDVQDTNTHIQKKGKRNIDNRKIEQATGKKLVTKNLYTQCKSTVSLFKFTGELQDKILEYLSLRLKMSDKPIYSASQWKAILVKLTKELAPDDPKQQLAIVNQSIERGYASFFPVSDYKKSSSHRRVDRGVSCEQYTEEEKKEIKKWQDKVVKNGGRIKF
jgi:DNA-binding transcriptional regulator GbsR (MarR family)